MRWRGGLAVAVVSMAAASLVACGGDDGSTGSGGGDDEGASPEFCDKAEAFNDATTSVRGIASADEMQEAVDQLDEVAEQAPTAIERGVHGAHRRARTPGDRHAHDGGRR